MRIQKLLSLNVIEIVGILASLEIRNNRFILVKNCSVQNAQHLKPDSKYLRKFHILSVKAGLIVI